MPVAGRPGHAELRQVLLVGLGDATAADFRRAGAALGPGGARPRGRGHHRSPPPATTTALTAFVVGAMLGSFVFHWRSQGARARAPYAGSSWPACPATTARAALERGSRSAAPAGGPGCWPRCRPTSRTRRGWPSRPRRWPPRAGWPAEVWDEHELAEEGFGGILGVGPRLATPPRLIRLDYTPDGGGRKTPTVVLVGKGITFDTGGLSIKPGEAMATMKRDMTGGAVVMAVMAALAALGLPASG